MSAEQEVWKARAATFKLAVGARLAFIDGTPDIIAYPETREGWGRLCRLLTKGNFRARAGKARPEKGECLLNLDDLLALAKTCC
jgi:error-prone DNA polymerase